MPTRKQKGDGLGVYGLDSASPAAIYMDLMCAGAYDNLPEPNYLHTTGLSKLAHWEWDDPRAPKSEILSKMMHLYGIVRFARFADKDALLFRMGAAIEAHQ